MSIPPAASASSTIIDKDVEVPIKDPLSGHTLLRLVGKLAGAGLLGTDTAAEGVLDELRLLTLERKQDLSSDDPNVGTLGASIKADLKQFPPGVSLELSIKKALKDEDRTSVELQARDIPPDPKVVANEAGVVTVKSENLPKDDLGEVVITTRVSIQWILEFGRANVRIAHVDEDGSVEILKAECESDPDNPLEFICTAKTNKGFSEFSLLALVDAPANFRASNLVAEPLAVEPGEGVKVSVDIANEGSQSGSFSAFLKLKGPEDADFKPEQVNEITLAPGDTGQVSFFLVKDVQGRYQIDVEGQRGAFDVARKLEAVNLRFSQLRLSVSPENDTRLRGLGLTPPTQVTPGTPVDITMLVSNAGDDDGRTELAVKINGAVAQIQSYAIPGRGDVDVTFIFTPPADGTYVIELIDLDEVVPPLTETVTAITPAAPARIIASPTLAITPREVSGGEEVTLRFDLTNFGEVAGTETFILLLNQREVARQTITVIELSGETITFTIRAPDEAGDYIATITNEAGELQPPTANFRVKAKPVEPSVADIRILDITSTVPREVEPGQLGARPRNTVGECLGV